MSIESEPIPRARRPELGEFRHEFVRRRRPVVITDAIDDWKALTKWSPSYFCSRVGEISALAYSFPERPRLDDHTPVELSRMTFSQFADAIESRAPKPNAQLLRYSHMPSLPALMDDVRVPPYCGAAPALKSNLLFSTSGMVVGLHFDLPRNLLAQVVGTKQVLLVAPEHGRYLYRHPWYSSLRHASPVHFEDPDLERYPLLRKCRLFTAVLEPGEMIFIPSGWWHQTAALETSVSINFWWASLATYPVVRGIDLYKQLTNLSISLPPRRRPI